MPEGEYLQYGGQAIIEGVMMRSPRYFAIACRAPNDEIVLHSEPLAKSWFGKIKWFKFPFIRGTFALIDAMALGIKALNFSSNVQLDEKYQPITEKTSSSDSSDDLLTPEDKMKSEKKAETIQNMAIGGAMFVGLAFGLLLFFLLPTKLTDWMTNHYGWSKGLQNMFDGGLRIVIFILYILGISQSKQIRRVFEYHGAEHKAINCYENKLDITVENALKQTRLHVRCGTSFIMFVLLLSIVIFAFLPRPEQIWLRFPLHLAVLPLIAGAAYEAIRFANRYCGKWITRIVFAPGLLSQYLTTREPDEAQVEVAVASLRRVMEHETETTKTLVAEP